MRKFSITAVFAVLICVAGISADDATVGGLYDIQYRKGDSYRACGGDKFVINALYFTVQKKLEENVATKFIIDGADMAKESTNASHKYIEEAQIIIKNVAQLPITVVFGKDEMPFGQDYDKSLFDPLVHGIEIDRVWGLNAGYKVNSLIKLEAGVWEVDGSTNIGISENYTARLTLSLLDNFTVKISFANIERRDAKDESRVGAGIVYTLGKTVLHGEYVGFDNPVDIYGGFAVGEKPTLIGGGADVFLTDTWKVKARYEMVDDDSPTDTFTGLIHTGIDYKIAEKTSLMLEYQKEIGEGANQDVENISVGIIASF